jgi:hypothetical protein
MGLPVSASELREVNRVLNLREFQISNLKSQISDFGFRSAFEVLNGGERNSFRSAFIRGHSRLFAVLNSTVEELVTANEREWTRIQALI